MRVWGLASVAPILLVAVLLGETGSTYAAAPPCAHALPPLTITHAPPSEKLLGLVGALRRPATSDDLLDPSKLFLPFVRNVNVDYIRLARRLDGTRYYLIPAQDQAPPIPTPACLRTMPHRVQEPYRRIAREFARQGPQEQLLVYPVGRSNGKQQGGAIHAGDTFTASSTNTLGCGPSATPEDLTAYPNLATCWLGAGPGRISQVVGIVPDGVAKVVSFYSRRYALHPHRPYRDAVTRVANVRNNVIIFHVPRAGIDAFPRRTTWLAPDGSVVRRFRGL